MRVVCCQCQKKIREKTPLSDNSVTHALCQPCLDEALARLGEKPRTQGNRAGRFDPHLKVNPQK
jgi:hypothetical protein